MTGEKLTMPGVVHLGLTDSVQTGVTMACGQELTTSAEWPGGTFTWDKLDTTCSKCLKVMYIEQRRALDKRDQLFLLTHMTAVVDAFYRQVQVLEHHRFLEFAGLMREFIAICRDDQIEGHAVSESPVTIKAYRKAYILEKLTCIFGEGFSWVTKPEPGVTSIDVVVPTSNE